MPIEIEKKYRLTIEQRAAVTKRLTELGAECLETEFETNTLYDHPAINLDNAVVRLRRTNDKAILTFKRRFASSSQIKHQLEEETEVGDADATEQILRQLGFAPSLIYEKRRQTWEYADTEIALDELPFGWFMEIEGEAAAIEEVERKLSITQLESEERTYPGLTRTHGAQRGDVIEARFPK